MRPEVVRLIVLVVAAGLMLGAIVGCGGGSEPEPTTDIQATIDAAVAAATPPDTPTPEPTETPAPTEVPTPDIPATVAAALAAAQPQPTAAPPTVAPPPTEIPPTNTPAPTNTPLPTHTPTPSPEQSSGPPCIIAGTVTVGNSPASEGTTVFGRSRTDNTIVEAETDANGRYVLAITQFDLVFDLFVGGTDTGQSTPITSRGCREIKNLTVR